MCLVQIKPLTHVENHWSNHCGILGGDEEQDFYIEKNTGSIVKARRLDAGRRSHYNLTVRVTDGFQAITTQVWAHMPNPSHIERIVDKLIACTSANRIRDERFTIVIRSAF